MPGPHKMSRAWREEDREGVPQSFAHRMMHWSLKPGGARPTQDVQGLAEEEKTSRSGEGAEPGVRQSITHSFTPLPWLFPAPAAQLCV